MGRGTSAVMGAGILAWLLAFLGGLLGLVLGAIGGWDIAASIVTDYQVTESLGKLVLYGAGVIIGSGIGGTVCGFVGMLLGFLIGAVGGAVLGK